MVALCLDCCHMRSLHLWHPLQDAVDRGWLRTERSIVHGTPDMDAIWTTAREIAAGMTYLHSLDILHGVGA